MTRESECDNFALCVCQAEKLRRTRRAGRTAAGRSVVAHRGQFLAIFVVQLVLQLYAADLRSRSISGSAIAASMKPTPGSFSAAMFLPGNVFQFGWQHVRSLFHRSRCRGDRGPAPFPLSLSSRRRSVVSLVTFAHACDDGASCGSGGVAAVIVAFAHYSAGARADWFVFFHCAGKIKGEVFRSRPLR